MADSRPIQRLALGLLGGLNLKVGGSNPDVLLEGVRCGIDVTDWMFTQIRQQIGESIVVAAGAAPWAGGWYPAVTDCIIPDGEAWWVYNATVTFNLGVGDEVLGGNLGVGVRGSQALPFVQVLSTICVPPLVPSVAGNILAHGVDCRRVFTAGCQFGIFVPEGVMSAAGNSATLELEIARLAS